MYKSAEGVKTFGGKIIREPSPLPILNTKITAVLDPDGWKSVRGYPFSQIFQLHKKLNCWLILWNIIYIRCSFLFANSEFRFMNCELIIFKFSSTMLTLPRS